jgi:glycosyltransferase involved in cell wall biosynthesis
MSVIPTFDQMPDRETDICLIAEGCYPHVAGGVSTWIDWLMRSLPELSFTVVSIVSGRESRESKFAFPDNLKRFMELDLRGPDQMSWARSSKISPRDAERLIEILLDFARTGRVGALRNLVAVLNCLPGPPSFQDLTRSELAWQMVCGMYNRLMPHTSFIDFFWAWQSLFGGLFAVLKFPLPRARIHHTISTGYAGLLAARAATETGNRTLVTEHGIYTNERRIEILMADWIVDTVDKGLSISDRRMDLRDLWIMVFESYARACYDACETITTLYEDQQSVQRNLGADPAKLTVIPNGIDVARFEKIVRDVAETAPTIALIGRVVPIKDIETFLSAAAEVARAVPGLRALVMGPADEDPAYAAECAQLVAELGLERTVVFTGRVDVTEWLGTIDVVVLTSLSEAQPLTVLEAGAAGIPCVTTNVGACREILFGRADEVPAFGAGGVVTDVVAPGQIAQSVIRLLRDDQLRHDMGKRLRDRVRRFYASDVARDAYQRLYQGATSENGSARWLG